MALQDLTPQLRTRLSRLEQLVGWFVTVAILLLAFGLAYYVYQTAQRKGWFLKKLPYFTFVRNASGLSVGDRVRLMGFDVGEIVEITAQPPDDPYFNVYIRFRVVEPYYGYLWEDSRARVGSADFLGHRFIEVTKGTNGAPTYAMHELREVSLHDAETLVGGTNNFVFAAEILDASKTNLLVHASELLSKEKLAQVGSLDIERIQVIDKNAPVKAPKWIWDDKIGRYHPFNKGDKGYWLRAEESPALSERLEKVVNAVEAALPDFLALTNRLTKVLTNAAAITAHMDDLLVGAKPIVTNLAQISSHISGPKGSLGEWLLPTNVNQQLQNALSSANITLATAQTNLNVISSNLLLSLENLAGITSNLNAQVQMNSNLVTSLNTAIIHSDQFVQGLKRHWLLRSAFKEKKTNQPPASPPVRSPKGSPRP